MASRSLVAACLFILVASYAGCGCSGTGLEGTVDGEDTEGEPDDPGTTDVPSDAETEPEVPTVLPECGESSGETSYFLVDGTDWASEPTTLDLVCDFVGGMSSELTVHKLLHCFSEEGVESYRELAFGASPGLSGPHYAYGLHALLYSADPGFQTNRSFSMSSTSGELEVAGIDADSLMEGVVYLGPIALGSVRGNCEIDDAQMGDPERIAVRVSCGSTSVVVFDGNMVDLTCPGLYRVVVGEAIAYHSPEEFGVEWPDSWFSVLIVRRRSW